MVPSICACFNKAMRDGDVPSLWRDVIICILFEKGDVRDCNNYRGLSLITHVCETLERAIQQRLMPYAEANKLMPESQHGFRPDRSTVDAIFVSRLLSSSSPEIQRPLYKCFVDLTKAYDKVDRDTLWKVLLLRGILPRLLVQLIQALHCEAQARVRVDGAMSEAFNLERGLKQGSVFAPLLFNIFFGAIIESKRKRVQHLGVKFNNKEGGNVFIVNELKRKKGVVEMSITELLFADDAVLMSDMVENLQKIVDAFVEVTEAFGQEVSIKKKEVMVINVQVHANPFSIFIKGKKLNVVHEFKYVGSTETETAKLDR